jgi:hypothetical protein
VSHLPPFQRRTTRLRLPGQPGAHARPAAHASDLPVATTLVIVPVPPFTPTDAEM